MIGAARSGTNILRDILCRFPGFGSWPCDEINYVWRHGNATHPTDELAEEHARPEVRRYVRGCLDRLARRGGYSTVVEKTCANSLRVPFVAKILPEARYVFVVRDGRDVVASAMERWRAPLDLPYLLRKARFVPTSDVPYYAARYLRNRLFKVLSRERRLASWGPRFEGMEEAAPRGLAMVCARQWERCVTLADTALSRLDPSRVHRLRYEDLVADPEAAVEQLGRFAGAEVDGALRSWVARNVSPRRAAGVSDELRRRGLEEVEAAMGPVLRRFGYLP